MFNQANVQVGDILLYKSRKWGDFLGNLIKFMEAGGSTRMHLSM